MDHCVFGSHSSVYHQICPRCFRARAPASHLDHSATWRKRQASGGLVWWLFGGSVQSVRRGIPPGRDAGYLTVVERPPIGDKNAGPSPGNT